MDQCTLLATPATNGGVKQPTVLGSDDGYVSARFRQLTPASENEGALLQAVVQFAGVRWISLAYDQHLREIVSCAAWTHEEADAELRAELTRRGVPVAEGYTRLRPIRPNGSKRAAVVRSDDGGFSARVRVHLDPDEGDVLVRLRLQAPVVGFRHSVIDERGTLIASASASTDADAWTRVRNEMARQGYDVE